MTTHPKNIGDVLDRLTENSATELDAVERLANAIRRADERMLEEVRSVTLMHEARREAIFGELQHLANRLCALPTGHTVSDPIPVIHQPPLDATPVSIGPQHAPCAGDWREATQRIDEEIDQYFGRSGPRH